MIIKLILKKQLIPTGGGKFKSVSLHLAVQGQADKTEDRGIR